MLKHPSQIPHPLQANGHIRRHDFSAALQKERLCVGLFCFLTRLRSVLSLPVAVEIG